jgi:hypothetical protein
MVEPLHGYFFLLHRKHVKEQGGDKYIFHIGRKQKELSENRRELNNRGLAARKGFRSIVPDV